MSQSKKNFDNKSRADLIKQIDQIQSEMSEFKQQTFQRMNVLETLIAQIHTGVILVDESGQIRLINSTATDILNLPENWVPFIDGLQSVSALKKVYDELREQEGEGDIQHEYCIQVPGGKARHIRLCCQRVRAALSRYYILEINDITDHY